MSELLVRVDGSILVREGGRDGGVEYYRIDTSYRPATPCEIANAFWSLWWGANSKPTVDQIEAVQTACKVVEELTGAPDETE